MRNDNNEEICDRDRRVSSLIGRLLFKLCQFIPASKGRVFLTPPDKKIVENGKFYGIGIGPGDPKLLTIKAKEILENVSAIFVPKADKDANSYARSIIEESGINKNKIVELTFPMTKNMGTLKSHWKEAIRTIEKEIKEGRDSAFITIGDPMLYSTYIYILEIIKKDFPLIKTETIPGISAFSAAASRVEIPLVIQDETLAIIPVREDLKGIREALKNFNTVVLMKIGAKIDLVIELLKELNLIDNSILISHVGQNNEKIIYDLKTIKDKKLGYLSVIIVKTRER